MGWRLSYILAEHLRSVLESLEEEEGGTRSAVLSVAVPDVPTGLVPEIPRRSTEREVRRGIGNWVDYFEWD